MEGTYLFPKTTSFVTEILTIDKGGQFKYYYYDCTYLKLGQGHIKETKDSIILRFERMPKANYQSFDTQNETGDSLSIILNGYYDGDPSIVTGGDVWLKNLQKGTVFNADGKAILTCIRPNINDTLIVKVIGYVPIQIPVYPSNSSISGDVFFSNTFYYDKGESLTYAKDDKGRIQAYPGNYYYSKISKSKAQRIIKKRDRNDAELLN